MPRAPWLLLVAAACGGPPGAAPQGGDFRRRVEAHCTEATKRLEDYLGKQFTAPVPVEVTTPKEVGALFRRFMEDGPPEAFTKAMQRLSERLHLVPPGYDIAAKELEMFETVAGVYDPEEDRFYVVESPYNGVDATLKVTVTHELVHAYRDVDTDYWARSLKLYLANADEAQALEFLIEGDATLLGCAIGYTTANEDVDAMARAFGEVEAIELERALAMPEIAEFPLALREPLMAPYVEGWDPLESTCRHASLSIL